MNKPNKKNNQNQYQNYQQVNVNQPNFNQRPQQFQGPQHTQQFGYNQGYNPNNMQQFNYGRPNPNMNPQFQNEFEEQPALSATQMHMLTTPFSYPDNYVVSVPQNNEAQRNQVADSYIIHDYANQPMPLNPLPNQQYMGEYAPVTQYTQVFHSPKDALNQVQANQINMTAMHDRMNVQSNSMYSNDPQFDVAPNPFHQPQFNTEQFQQPVFNRQQSQMSSLQQKMNELDRLLRQNMISPETYQKRKQSLIDKELNNF
ncbi:hypothetical protein EI74_0685 [Mycoplasma testudineum]|uniref:SHOCT domain-containing protein n=1 Tax=Mycoplasma testudineum TaxID=244584 RepID=A0A4R6ICQ0_9MOLU|nr:hypothetical protein [Mycoplasma testudineum]OYD26584.1 hypothetical protein CG473_03020 [Mycoplasma testudineum]TDO19416.1 hypothetical protein EI74_0685 [Mycoplasma testudineum]